MSAEPFPVQWTGDQAVVLLAEQMDVSNAGQIRELLLAVINGGARILIADMSATVSCDQAASDALARAYQRAVASGTEMRLVAPSTVVRRVLSLTGIDRLMPVYPALEAALAAHASSLVPSAVSRPGDSAGWRAGARQVRDGDRPRPPQPGAGTGVTSTGVTSTGVTDAGVTDVGVEIALLDHDGTIVSVNQAWLAFAEANGGDPARTGLGMSYLEACAAAGNDPAAAQVADAIRAALAGDLPGPLAIEVPCHSPAAERWYHVLISSRPGRDGRNLGAAVTLSLARSGLRSPPADPGADTVLAMLDAISDGIALTDSGGTLLFTNRRLEEMFGFERAELRGQPVEKLVPAPLHHVHRRHRAGYAQAPVARPMGAGTRLVGLRKDGSTFPAEISLSPLPAGTGQFTLTVVRDVTAAWRGAEPGAQQAPRSVLDDIISEIYRAGLSLERAADLVDAPASRYVAEALDRLDHIVSVIHDATLTRAEPGAPPPGPARG